MENLKNLRLSRHLTQQDMADALGCSTPTYNRYETGERRPSIPVLKQLSQLLDVPVDSLISDSAPKSSDLFGPRLTALRHERNLTRLDVSESLGVNQFTLRNYEIGTRQPDHDFLMKAADFYGVSVDFLLGHAGDSDESSMNTFRMHRLSAGLSQKQAALEIGVKQPSMCAWETGKAYPTYENLLAMAQLYNVSVDALVGAPAAAPPPEPSVFPASVALRLKEARTLAGFTQKEIASRMGIAVQTYNGYETGKHDPGAIGLYMISAICGVSSDYLLGRDVPPDWIKKSPSPNGEELGDGIDAITDGLLRLANASPLTGQRKAAVETAIRLVGSAESNFTPQQSAALDAISALLLSNFGKSE